jgi:hypothetical protein
VARIAVESVTKSAALDPVKPDKYLTFNKLEMKRH